MTKKQGEKNQPRISLSSADFESVKISEIRG